MTLATEEVVPVGTKVTLTSGAKARIEGLGTVYRNKDDSGPDEMVTVYEVELTEDHVGRNDVVTFEGTRLLLYRKGFTVEQEFDVTVTYKFSSRVRANTEDAAREALIGALVERLMSDQEAPDALAFLRMWRVP